MKTFDLILNFVSKLINTIFFGTKAAKRKLSICKNLGLALLSRTVVSGERGKRAVGEKYKI
jgi:hypothetical protein